MERIMSEEIDQVIRKMKYAMLLMDMYVRDFQRRVTHVPEFRSCISAFCYHFLQAMGEKYEFCFEAADVLAIFAGRKRYAFHVSRDIPDLNGYEQVPHNQFWFGTIAQQFQLSGRDGQLLERVLEPISIHWDGGMLRLFSMEIWMKMEDGLSYGLW